MEKLLLRNYDRFNDCFWYSENRTSMFDYFNMIEQFVKGGNHIEDCQLYIGLEDCTGKKMYDGDIIKFRANYCPRSKPMGELVGVIKRKIYKTVIMVGDIEYSAEEETDEFPYHHCEVIGNIHQNKDLLEIKKAANS